MSWKPSFDRRELVLGAASLGLSALPARVSSQGAALQRLNIGNTQGLASQTLATMMRQQKLFEEFGLEPNILGVADGTKLVSALIGGDVDYAALSGFAQVFPAIERGGRLKIIGAGGTLLSVLAMFTGKSEIQSLKDLEGKTIGSGSTGSLLHQLTVALFKKKGVDHTKVRFVNIGSSVDVFRAVSAGVVDAGLGDGNFMMQMEKFKVRVLPGGQLNIDLPEYTLQGAYTTDRAIETKRDALVRAMAAYGKLFRMLQSPDGKEAFMKAREEVAKSEGRAENEGMWQYIQNTKPYGVNLIIDEARISYMQQLNVDFGVQKAILPYEKVADMSIARDALKLLGGPI